MPRFLIVAPSWVGDTVLAQPLFMRLKARVPKLTLDVLAPPWVAGVLSRMPEVDETIDNPFRHGELKVFARRRLGIALKARRYERAIVLPNSAKSALPPYFASIPLRTGYRGELRLGLLNDVRMLDERRLPLMVERFAALAEAPRAPLQRPLPSPRLHADVSNRRALVRSLGLSVDRPIVVFCPGAEYGPAKRWPAQHFSTLALSLAGDGYAIWLIGSANDRAIADEIVAGAGQHAAITNLCGKTQLAGAVDLISAAALVLSNDSGLMHVAAALERPLIALFGSSSPEFTPPLSAQATILNLELDCSPCFKRECPLVHLRCLNDLTPRQVQAVAREKLATKPVALSSPAPVHDGSYCPPPA
jgi:heptosyltransferase-2